MELVSFSTHGQQLSNWYGNVPEPQEPIWSSRFLAVEVQVPGQRSWLGIASSSKAYAAALAGEVATLVNLVSRDVRSCTGSNIRFITEQYGKDPWVESSGSIRSGLREKEAVHVQDQDKWRVGYLGLLLAQRQSWKYMGAEDEEEEVQNLVDSLCIN